MRVAKTATDIKSSCAFPKSVIILNVITDDCSLVQTPEHDVIINEGWLGGMKIQVQNSLIAACSGLLKSNDGQLLQTSSMK